MRSTLSLNSSPVLLLKQCLQSVDCAAMSRFSLSRLDCVLLSCAVCVILSCVVCVLLSRVLSLFPPSLCHGQCCGHFLDCVTVLLPCITDSAVVTFWTVSQCCFLVSRTVLWSRSGLCHSVACGTDSAVVTFWTVSQCCFLVTRTVPLWSRSGLSHSVASL